MNGREDRFLAPLSPFQQRASRHDHACCPSRQVIKPLLASCCQRKRGRKPKNVTPLNAHYEHLQEGMRELFDEPGIAA
jgi:hypothetical protein